MPCSACASAWAVRRAEVLTSWCVITGGHAHVVRGTVDRAVLAHPLFTVPDELYALALALFTAARDERAKAARAAGDRGLAEQIRTGWAGGFGLLIPGVAGDQCGVDVQDQAGHFPSAGFRRRYAAASLGCLKPGQFAGPG